MAERDLSELLKTLSVKRHDGVWRFETYDLSFWNQMKSIGPSAQAIMIFKEEEGVTVITPADRATPEENHWVWLELSVYSDLRAVGFLGKVAEALAQAGIPCNTVAAFHHDHIFVPLGKADRAVQALQQLAQESR